VAYAQGLALDSLLPESLNASSGLVERNARKLAAVIYGHDAVVVVFEWTEVKDLEGS
jgi:hypothetical protein